MTEPTTGNFLTKTKAFQKLVDQAFIICDNDKRGEVKKQELYSGVLLVHLNLAKYVGPAACYPPQRYIVDHLFDASDGNFSNGITREEFYTIIEICCGQIMNRILIYYTILFLVVPWLTIKAVNYLHMNHGSYQELCTEQVTSMTIFFIIIPQIWNYIDIQTQQSATTKARDITKKKH